MFSRWIVLVLTVTLLTPVGAPGSAEQEKQWRELQALTGKLMAERRFHDALRAGEMANVLAEQIWGAESSRVADGVNNLATLYFYTNQPDLAETMYRRAIDIYDKQNGLLSLKSLNPHKSLARLCEVRGKIDSARRHYTSAISIAEDRFGPEHPVTDELIFNMARLLIAQGEMAPADTLLRRSLAFRTKRHGPNSKEVAAVLRPLVHVYLSQGITTGLDAVANRVLEIQMQNVSSDDPSLIPTYIDLGDIYRLTDRPELASTKYRRALVLQEQHFGPDYYPEQASFTNFATVTVNGKDAGTVLTAWNQPVGKDHVARMALLDNLAAALCKQGQPEEALPFYERSLAIAERAYGPDHPATAEAVKHLAETTYSMGNLDAARPYYERIADLCHRARKRDDAALEQYLQALSEIYFMEQRYDEAADAYARIIELQRKSLGDSHPKLASTLNNLAEVKRLQGLSDEAESMYTQALSIYDPPDAAPTDLSGLNAVLGNLIRFYEHTDRPQAAALMRERRDAATATLPSPTTIALP